MPALDTLQSKLGGDAFEVVAVNIDTRDTDKPKAWLKDAGIARLGYYQRQQCADFSGSEDDQSRLRHADIGADRSAGLRDCVTGGSGRMGERAMR